MTKVLFTRDSSNKKIGHIAATYSERATCPDTCKLKQAGCYAEGYPTRHHWDAISKTNGKSSKNHFEWDDFLLQVRALPKGKMMRLNVAGDLPGVNNEIDGEKITNLLDACNKVNAFTYTHKPVGFGDVGESHALQKIRASNSQIVKHANQNGVTVNLSADDINQADYLSSLNIGPVVCVMPMDAPRHSKTPEGKCVSICPNEEDPNITCEKCKLCAIPNRKVIIGFRAHGFRKHQVTKAIKKRLNVLQ